MSYIHPKKGTKFTSYNGHKEHVFYEETTKRQMLFIIEQMAEILKSKDQDWIDKAIEEREIIKLNGIC